MKLLILLLSLMVNINYNQILNPNHIELFQTEREEVLVRGATGAGKTYSIADKLLTSVIWQPGVQMKALVIRKTFPSLRASTLDIIERRAAALHLPFILNESKWQAKVQGLTILFRSLHDKQAFDNLKSMTDLDWIWFNELLEFREDDYEESLRRLRGGESYYSQIISDFNPYDKYSWVHKRFYEKNIGDALKLHYTIDDNHPAYMATDKYKRFRAKIERYKTYNQNLYDVYFNGEWGSLEGVIFNWPIVQLPDTAFDKILYGGDFGFSNNPAALVKIYVKGNCYWIQEIFYETGLTNMDIARKMKVDTRVDHEASSTWDNNEPKSIEELNQLGISAKPCIKGKDSVNAGIDFMLGQKDHTTIDDPDVPQIFIIEGSENLIQESRTYVWEKDKNGKNTNKPVKANDHLMDGSRYAIYTDHKSIITEDYLKAHIV